MESLLQPLASFLEAELQREKNLAKEKQKGFYITQAGCVMSWDHQPEVNSSGTYNQHSTIEKPLCPNSAPPCWFFFLGISRHLNEVQDINSIFLILLGLGLVTDFLSNIQSSLHSWLSFPNI